MISLSYSRISLADIAQKLQLDSPEDAEFIVAKVAAYEVLAFWVLGCPQPLILAAGLALLPGCLCPVPAVLPSWGSRQFQVEAPPGDAGDTQGTKSPPCALCPEPTAPVTAASSSLHSKLLPQPSETAGALTACPPACRPFGTV